MTDGTAFKLRVFYSVCLYMGAEHSATFVTCKMHMLMMFNQKAQKVFQSYHNNLGHAKRWFSGQNCF